MNWKKKGALLFSPPAKSVNEVLDLDNRIDVTRKFHICTSCYEKIINLCVTSLPKEIEIPMEM